jgi:hypothetical protein
MLLHVDLLLDNDCERSSCTSTFRRQLFYISLLQAVEALGLWEVEAPKLLKTNGLEMAARLSALRAGRSLPPRFLFYDSWYSFLLEAESTQGHNAAGRVRSIRKNPPHLDAIPRPSGL